MRKQHNQILLGFDGFEDSLFSVIQSRNNNSDYKLFSSLKDFGESISSQEGKNINYEIMPKLHKMGGNGPLLAYALSKYNFPICYMGTLGETKISSIYSPLVHPAIKNYTFGKGGSTSALEFSSGKILLGDHSNIAHHTLETFFKKIPPELFEKEFSNSSLFGSLNWTMLPFQEDLWKWILNNKTLSSLENKPTWFIDFSDPKKRSQSDFKNFLLTIKQVSNTYPLILGMNLSELTQAFQCLFNTNQTNLNDMAKDLYHELGLSKLVIHNRKFAFSFTNKKFFKEKVPTIDQPKITTGAGDHFNAGYLAGTLNNFEESKCLKMGISSSGFYIRKGYTPSKKELYEFLKSWQNRENNLSIP